MMAPGKPDKSDPRVWNVARTLDRPSVYMGGPKQSSLRKAQQIVDALDAMESERKALALAPTPDAGITGLTRCVGDGE